MRLNHHKGLQLIFGFVAAVLLMGDLAEGKRRRNVEGGEEQLKPGSVEAQLAAINSAAPGIWSRSSAPSNRPEVKNIDDELPWHPGGSAWRMPSDWSDGMSLMWDGPAPVNKGGLTAADLAPPGWAYLSARYSDTNRLNGLREEVEKLFTVSWNSYMAFAWNEDELKPLSCSGRGREGRGTDDDILGGFHLTAIDGLDTLAVMGHREAFRAGVEALSENGALNFARSTTVSVFETIIRVVGGLLSGHALAERELEMLKAEGLEWDYDGALLRAAVDISDRLLPAFDTASGLPWHRVNLITGVASDESSRTCTAAAGSALLEWTTLSRMTGDDRYWRAAQTAVDALWGRRDSRTGLVGTHISTVDGSWLDSSTGIGSSVDSFYEYLGKAEVVTGNASFSEMFESAYSSVMAHSPRYQAWFLDVSRTDGSPAKDTITTHSAFWPGLQAAFAGDVDGGVRAHSAYVAVTLLYGGAPFPDVWDAAKNNVPRGGAPYTRSWALRPEVIESAWYLHEATGDPHYLAVGELFLSFLRGVACGSCGCAAVGDVRTWELDDRMDSFFLAETLKYLYLLFSPENHWVSDESTWVFSTEGHPLPTASAQSSLHASQLGQGSGLSGVAVGVDELVVSPERNGRPQPSDDELSRLYKLRWNGTLESGAPSVLFQEEPALPQGDKVTVDVAAEALEEQISQLGCKVVVGEVENSIRVQCFDPTTQVTVSPAAAVGEGMIQLAFETAQIDGLGLRLRSSSGVELALAPAVFGGDWAQIEDNVVSGVGVQMEPFEACDPSMTNSGEYEGKIAFAVRGSCTFYEKALTAQKGGALGLVVVALDEVPFFMHGPLPDDPLLETPVTIPLGMMSQGSWRGHSEHFLGAEMLTLAATAGPEPIAELRAGRFPATRTSIITNDVALKALLAKVMAGEDDG